MRLLSRLDTFQRRRSWVGFPLAVIYKFGDDQGPYLAALITYYAFLSLFPLLLILTTVLGFVLSENPQLQGQLIDSALSEFPIIGDQLTNNARPLQGSGLGLAIGAAIALYGGLGLSLALQHALNQVWGVPMRRRPDPLLARLRGLVLMIMLGLGLVVTTVLSALTTVADSFGAQLGLGARVAAALLSIAANAALFVLAFRLLTARRVTTRQVLPGAIVAALAFQGLQVLGAWFVGFVLRGANQAYGLFGLVFGLLAFIYLEAQAVVLAAEMNAVRARKLWPRSLLAPNPADDALTPADRRSYESYATTQQFKDAQEVTVTFKPSSSQHRTGDDEPREG